MSETPNLESQSSEERIVFLEDSLQLKQGIIDSWNANSRRLWDIVDSQAAQIETLTRQRDAARLELAGMIAVQQMIMGHKDFTPEQVLNARGWSIDWNKLDTVQKDVGSDAK